MLFSEPKIPHRELAQRPGEDDEFQCSSASRKFLTSRWRLMVVLQKRVSVLFSEPKIPHFRDFAAILRLDIRFSALQRAENSSPGAAADAAADAAAFQCSSASRKFLTVFADAGDAPGKCFSALQRAENSSPGCAASLPARATGFSALQRAENSSHYARDRLSELVSVSVLFSEPKIPHIIDKPIRKLFRQSFSALQRAENSSP